jgi:tetratricopeptide (TPR) repeat protein
MSDPLQAQITIRRMDAHVAAKSGDKDRARALYMALSSDHPDNKAIYVNDAIGLLESLLARIGDRQTLLACLAQILSDAQRWADASAVWRRWLAIVWDIDVAAKLGYSLLMSGSLDEAEAVFQKVVAADPTNAEAHALFAKVLMMRGKTIEALAAADAALARNAKSKTHCLRGEILLAMDQPILAAMAYQRALDSTPDYPIALAGLAEIKAKQQKRPRVMAYGQRVLVQNPAGGAQYLAAAWSGKTEFRQ